MPPLQNKFKKTILRYNLINKGENILIGVSGGPDSVSLLYMFDSIKKEFGLKLNIAHLNHMLRGKESDRDESFVGALALKLKIPLFVKRADITKIALKKASIEETAREERLNFLLNTAAKIKADKIALGHTRDDQSETVLMRILRGSGLYGLRAILPKRQIGNLPIIRPLIHISRNEIESFLKKNGIKTRLDRSNLQPIYFRNRVRKRLFRILEKYNPNIKEILANMAESVSIDYDYISGQSRKVFNNISAKNKKSSVNLILVKLLKLHPAIQNMVLRLAFENLKGDTRRLTYQHTKELRDLIYLRPDRSIVDLPFNISAVKNPRYIKIYKRPFAPNLSRHYRGF